MYCLERYNRLTVGNLLVIDFGSACIGFSKLIQDRIHKTRFNNPNVLMAEGDLNNKQLELINHPYYSYVTITP